MTAALHAAGSALALASAVLWLSGRRGMTAAFCGFTGAGCWAAAEAMRGQVPFALSDGIWAGFCAWAWHRAFLDGRRDREADL